jgi:hypothetical protein
MFSILYPTGSLWLIDAHGPVYFETTLLVVGHHTIKVWQAMIHAAIECVAFLSAVHALQQVLVHRWPGHVRASRD